MTGYLFTSTLGSAVIALSVHANTSSSPYVPPELPVTAVDEVGRVVSLDPRIFFEQLVTRYRSLRAYSETTSIVQITRPIGEGVNAATDHRVERHVQCDVQDGKLRIHTPAAQLLGGLGGGLLRTALGLADALPIDIPQPIEDAQHSYELWLLPHMSLKFADDPLHDFRAGVPEGFTATRAEPVSMEDSGGRPMVHLELKSGDGLSEHYSAKFNLYVDPDSMLIERIEGEQRLPDGNNLHTSLAITPTWAESEPDDTPKSAAPAIEPVAIPCVPHPVTSADGAADEDADEPREPYQPFAPAVDDTAPAISPPSPAGSDFDDEDDWYSGA